MLSKQRMVFIVLSINAGRLVELGLRFSSSKKTWNHKSHSNNSYSVFARKLHQHATPAVLELFVYVYFALQLEWAFRPRLIEHSGIECSKAFTEQCWGRLTGWAEAGPFSEHWLFYSWVHMDAATTPCNQISTAERIRAELQTGLAFLRSRWALFHTTTLPLAYDEDQVWCTQWVHENKTGHQQVTGIRRFLPTLTTSVEVLIFCPICCTVDTQMSKLYSITMIATQPL